MAVSARRRAWQSLVRDKMQELDAQEQRIAAMRSLLARAAKCRCLDVAECGRVLLKLKSGKLIAER